MDPHEPRARAEAAEDAPSPPGAPTGEPGEGQLTYPDPPAQLTNFGLKGALRVFGPGAIIASVTIGSGEVLFPARGGAVFGYGIIWMLVVGAVLKGAMMYASNRYIVVTGEHPIARFAHTIPGPKRWFPILLCVITLGSFPFIAGGVSLIIGDYLSFLSGGSGRVWATGFLLACALFAWFGGYGIVEKGQIFIVALMMIAVLAAVFVSKPDWLAWLYGFVPHPLSYDAWVGREYPQVAARPLWVETVTYLGALGGGLFDYIGYTGMMREKRWGLLGRDDIRRLNDEFERLPRGQRLPLPDGKGEIVKAKLWSRAPGIDVALSVAVMTIAAIAFTVNGANLLHDQHLVPAGDELLRHQTQFLQVIHPALTYFYYVAVFFAFFGTVFGVWEVYSSTGYETLRAVFPNAQGVSRPRVRQWIYIYVLVFALLLLWTTSDPVTLITPALLVGGVLGIGLFALALLYTERRVLSPEYRLRGVPWWLTLSAGVVLTAFGVIAVFQEIGFLPSGA